MKLILYDILITVYPVFICDHLTFMFERFSQFANFYFRGFRIEYINTLSGIKIRYLVLHPPEILYTCSDEPIQYIMITHGQRECHTQG